MEVWSKIKIWFKTNHRWTIWLLTVILGLIAHFELCVSNAVIYGGQLNYELYLANNLLTHGINTAFFSTIISLTIMGFIAIILMDLLKIKKIIYQILIILLLIINPAYATILMYPHISIQYSFSLLLAVISVYFFNSEKSPKNALLSIFFMVTSIFIYQASLNIITFIWLLLTMFKLIENKSIKIKAYLARIGYDLSIIGFCLIIYYLLTLLFIQNNNLAFNISDLGKSIQLIYQSFLKFYFTDIIFINTIWSRHILYFLLITAIILNFLIIIMVLKHSFKGILIFLEILLIPLFIYPIGLITQEYTFISGITPIMSYAFFSLFVLLIKQFSYLENMNYKFWPLLKHSGILVITWIIYTYFLSNTFTYVGLGLYNRQIVNQANEAIIYLNNNYNINENTKIVFIGNMDFNKPNIIKRSNFNVYQTLPYTYQYYVQNNIRIQNPITFDNYDKSNYDYLYDSLKTFPSSNSIKQIGDEIIVKIGERSK